MLPELALYFDRIEGRLDNIKEYLEEIGDDAEQLNWRPEIDEPSIFSLAAFVAMNTDYWIGHALGNFPIPPGFEDVLEQAHGDDPDPLIRRLDSSRETTRKVFEKLNPADLDTTININDEPVTARQCILQALEDAAERDGEIRTMMQWWGSE
jgi:hypothetical protein